MLSPSQASVTGSIRKQVACESCGHNYDYRMVRTGSGSYSGFAWNDEEGQAKALPEAHADLQEKLATGCDVVPCPKCGALTREMRDQRASAMSALPVLIILGAGVAVGAFLGIRNYLAGVWPAMPLGFAISIGLSSIVNLGFNRKAAIFEVVDERPPFPRQSSAFTRFWDPPGPPQGGTLTKTASEPPLSRQSTNGIRSDRIGILVGDDVRRIRAPKKRAA